MRWRHWRHPRLISSLRPQLGWPAQRDAIAAVLAELPTAFGDVRNALNEMARIIAGHADRQAAGGSDSSSPLG